MRRCEAGPPQVVVNLRGQPARQAQRAESASLAVFVFLQPRGNQRAHDVVHHLVDAGVLHERQAADRDLDSKGLPEGHVTSVGQTGQEIAHKAQVFLGRAALGQRFHQAVHTAGVVLDGYHSALDQRSAVLGPPVHGGVLHGTPGQVQQLRQGGVVLRGQAECVAYQLDERVPGVRRGLTEVLRHGAAGFNCLQLLLEVDIRHALSQELEAVGHAVGFGQIWFFRQDVVHQVEHRAVQLRAAHNCVDGGSVRCFVHDRGGRRQALIQADVTGCAVPHAVRTAAEFIIEPYLRPTGDFRHCCCQHLRDRTGVGRLA